MSTPKHDWTVWLSYRSAGKRAEKRYRRDGGVIRGHLVWFPVLTVHRSGVDNLRRDARDAIVGIHPWIKSGSGQWNRVKILPVGRVPA